ncbi:hypothetical protein COU36_00145, partial [Candidatus Micrarchaeota archaeon CG10_big_fil_rev_8_21_14_0_10_59_7]
GESKENIISGTVAGDVALNASDNSIENAYISDANANLTIYAQDASGNPISGVVLRNVQFADGATLTVEAPGTLLENVTMNEAVGLVVTGGSNAAKENPTIIRNSVIKIKPPSKLDPPTVTHSLLPPTRAVVVRAAYTKIEDSEIEAENATALYIDGADGVSVTETILKGSQPLYIKNSDNVTVSAPSLKALGKKSIDSTQAFAVNWTLRGDGGLNPDESSMCGGGMKAGEKASFAETSPSPSPGAPTVTPTPIAAPITPPALGMPTDSCEGYQAFGGKHYSNAYPAVVISGSAGCNVSELLLADAVVEVGQDSPEAVLRENAFLGAGLVEMRGADAAVEGNVFSGVSGIDVFGTAGVTGNSMQSSHGIVCWGRCGVGGNTMASAYTNEDAVEALVALRAEQSSAYGNTLATYPKGFGIAVVSTSNTAFGGGKKVQDAYLYDNRIDGGTSVYFDGSMAVVDSGTIESAKGIAGSEYVLLSVHSRTAGGAAAEIQITNDATSKAAVAWRVSVNVTDKAGTPLDGTIELTSSKGMTLSGTFSNGVMEVPLNATEKVVGATAAAGMHRRTLSFAGITPGEYNPYGWKACSGGACEEGSSSFVDDTLLPIIIRNAFASPTPSAPPGGEERPTLPQGTYFKVGRHTGLQLGNTLETTVSLLVNGTGICDPAMTLTATRDGQASASGVYKSCDTGMHVFEIETKTAGTYRLTAHAMISGQTYDSWSETVVKFGQPPQATPEMTPLLALGAAAFAFWAIRRRRK